MRSRYLLPLGPPFLATAMACSDDRALGRVPAHGSDCGTLCRTASFRVGAFLGLRLLAGLRRRWWRLRRCCRLCLRWRLRALLRR